MNDVKVIAPPSLDGLRRAFVLAEDRIGHYPEFRRFFVGRKFIARRARADDHLVPFGAKSARQRLPDVAATQNSDLHAANNR